MQTGVSSARVKTWVEEQIQTHVKQFTRKLKGDKKMKHRRREPGSRASSSQSNKSRAMRRRTPKIPNFPAIRNQRNSNQADSHNELVLPQYSTSSSSTSHARIPCNSASDRNRCSPSYYGFDNSSSGSTIAEPPKQQRRAGDVENFQPQSVSVVETLQTTAIQLPKEANISPVIGEVTPLIRVLGI